MKKSCVFEDSFWVDGMFCFCFFCGVVFVFGEQMGLGIKRLGLSAFFERKSFQVFEIIKNNLKILRIINQKLNVVNGGIIFFIESGFDVWKDLEVIQYFV